MFYPLNKYVDYPSILKIREYFNETTEFNFSEIIPNDIEKEIKKLESSKKGTFKSVQIRSFFGSVFSPNTGKSEAEKTPYLDTFHAVITPKLLKETADVCSPL